ncbi:MAG: YbfB/YjiJ family MFS transporter [Nitrospiraceae bacterium]|nr:MAG: YbfB/YjiJ family MFS transporter [Nitrospiraceae bacterium]
MSESDQRIVSQLPFHYGWVIVGTGMLCIFACLGLGRFALGMLLPAMALPLDLSYSNMGFISTANFAGYLGAVLIGGVAAGKTGARKIISLALLLVGLSMCLISQAQTFIGVAVLYTLTGIGSGAANVPMMGLVSHWFSDKKRGKAAGFVVIGSGFAIILAGRFIPAVNQRFGPDGWRVNWLIIGAVSIVIAAICFLLLRDRPVDVGLKPAGTMGDADPRDRTAGTVINVYREKAIYLLGVIYFLFGYTYVIYATFIVTAMVRERGFTESAAGSLWSWIGLLSLLSGPLFGSLSDRIGRKKGLMTVFSFQMAAYFLVAFTLPDRMLHLSIFCFGIVAWSIPSIMIAAVSDYAGASQATAAFGLVTFIFGIGQITGPAVAGVLAEKTGSFSSSFFMAGVCAALALSLAAFLRKPQRSRS